MAPRVDEDRHVLEEAGDIFAHLLLDDPVRLAHDKEGGNPDWALVNLSFLGIAYQNTLIMLYKGQSIRDAGHNFENKKGQGLALSHIARDKKAWNRLGIGKGR